MKVHIECPGARGGDLPGALGVQPYEDPFRPQDASLSICRTDCSVTKTAKQSPNYCLKKPILDTETGLGKAIERFLDVCSVILILRDARYLSCCKIASALI